MNITYALLIFLAWQMLSKKQNTPFDLSKLLSPDKLAGLFKGDGKSDTGSLWSVLSNPEVISMLSSLFVKKENSYDNNYSKESQDFFKNVENVAGKEVSKKLYHLYDNWYTKTR